LPKIGPVVEPTINFLAEDELSARSDEVTLRAGRRVAAFAFGILAYLVKLIVLGLPIGETSVAKTRRYPSFVGSAFAAAASRRPSTLAAPSKAETSQRRTQWDRGAQPSPHFLK
jgi:hypothetical protein